MTDPTLSALVLAGDYMGAIDRLRGLPPITAAALAADAVVDLIDAGDYQAATDWCDRLDEAAVESPEVQSPEAESPDGQEEEDR